MNPRRWLCLAVVAVTVLVVLSGCGVTEWQRTRDALAEAQAGFDSPEFQAAVSRSNPGVPRK